MTVQQRKLMQKSPMMPKPVLPASNTSATSDHIAGMLSGGKNIIVIKCENPIYPR